MGHATALRAAMEVIVPFSVLISICLRSFDLDVLRIIVGPQRSVATAAGTSALVELLSRRGERELDGFAVACCCTRGAGWRAHSNGAGDNGRISVNNVDASITERKADCEGGIGGQQRVAVTPPA